MSDISKKIHSIDPEDSNDTSSKRGLNLSPAPNTEDDELLIPSFVTRNDSLTALYGDDEPPKKGIIISGVLLALLWLGLGITQLFMKGIDTLWNSPLHEIILIGSVITIPALLILFLAACLQKLGNIHSRAERLADIGDMLLKADETSAANASTLAKTIRSEIKQLNTDLTGANETLARLKDDTAEHLAEIQTATSKTVTLSDKVISNYDAQEQAIANLIEATSTQFVTLSGNMKTEKDALHGTIQEAEAVMSNLSEKLDNQLAQASKTAEDVEANILNSIQKMTALDEQVSLVSSDLTVKIKTVSEASEKLAEENKALTDQMDKHSAEFSKTAALSKQIEGNIAEQVEHAETVREQLKDITANAEAKLSEHLNSLNEELEKNQSLSKNNMTTLENTASDILEQFTAKANAIEEKLHSLNISLTNMDGRLQQSAETRELDMDLPIHHEPLMPASSSGKRLNLKPLDADIQSSGTQSLDPNPHAQLFDQISGLMQPLDLNDEVELSMPLPDISLSQTESEKSDFSELTSDDVIKPLTESGPLFGKSKGKTRSGWRWRDMMGGFNSEDISDTPSNSDDRSFLTHLNDINIDPDAIISDGIILDVANIYASQKEPIEPFLEKRLSDIAQHLQSHAENEVSFSDAAAVHKASFGETINENIMNAEAIRNQLSTPEGRVYLLSLMAHKR